MLYNQPFDKPPEVTYGDTPYINGNPATGQPGSIPSAASVEYPQREIVNLIKAAGLTPTNSDLTQVKEAVQIADVFNYFKFASNGGSASQWSAAIPALPTMPPPIGTTIWFLPLYDSVKGGTVFSVNGSAFRPVVNPDKTPITIGDVIGIGIVLLFFDGTSWCILAGSQSRVAGVLPLLQKNTNWYVNGITGNDTNYDGTSATVVSASIGPFSTIQRASDEILKYNMNNYNQQINIADGTYTGPVSLRALNGTGRVTIQGNSANPQNVTIQIPAGSNLYSCIFQTGGDYIYEGLRFTTGAGQLDGIASNNGHSQIGNVRFGPCARYHMSAGDSGTSMYVQGGTVTIEAGANAVSHMNAQLAGLLSFPAPVSSAWPSLNILGAVTFSQSFIGALALGIAQMHYTSITGAAFVTGPKYNGAANGVIDSYGGGGSYFPGSTAGSLATGAQYYT